MNRHFATTSYGIVFIPFLLLAILLETSAYAQDSHVTNHEAAFTGVTAVGNNDYEKVKVISRGTLVNVMRYTEPGRYTAFMFYADWCAPCKTLKPRLERFAESVDTFALREIDIINWENPLVAYYNLPSIPYFIIYGPDGSFLERGPAITNNTLKELTGDK